jgi:hypothetical protein
VVDRGRQETLPEKGITYKAHFDPSGGRVDAAALAIGHRDGDLIRVDLVRRCPAPHNPEAVISEAAEVLSVYVITDVQVHRFGADFPIRAFQRAGVRATTAEKVTSEHHLGMVPLVNAQRVVLPDHPDLLRELRGLERRTGTAGRDVATHRPAQHDDTAAAVSGLCALLPHRAPVTVAVPLYLARGRPSLGTGEQQDQLVDVVQKNLFEDHEGGGYEPGSAMPWDDRQTYTPRMRGVPKGWFRPHEE